MKFNTVLHKCAKFTYDPDNKVFWYCTGCPFFTNDEQEAEKHSAIGKVTKGFGKK